MLEEELPDSCALDDVDDTEDCELEALVELSWLDDDPPVGAELDEDPIPEELELGCGP
ncbi:MAG: hypothetical protein KDA69_00520 [Planctomycetaceae bacterium]|nr:hypothetical protein [Planctomycetaceae bacterium]MCA9029165.1 hypothetical protein [Planctomycetaceae bacterium]MCA9042766.1 hypothetical protein [Planctomycetaceae bacterium]MCB9953636.1 hypothetical protein [Planctomycetaceae bacterium]MCB9953649.1 hypothetical protein [Planctomycetaceae bacterium]